MKYYSITFMSPFTPLTGCIVLKANSSEHAKNIFCKQYPVYSISLINEC